MSNNCAGLRSALRGERGAAERCGERLLAMRKSLAPIRRRRSDSSLLLATGNIRDFDSNKFGFGPRRSESFYYIAEIVSCFDLVAVQEVNRDLSALETLMRILGREWDYIATDTTEGIGGNGERMAFLAAWSTSTRTCSATRRKTWRSTPSTSRRSTRRPTRV